MIVTVTGLMRSGTSIVARMLHQLGVPMGVYMRFPLPGNPESDLEWEDAALVEPLTRYTLAGDVERIAPLLAGYAAQRGDGLWGVKSPLLSLYREVWETAVGRPVLWIETHRPYLETLKSIQRVGGTPDVEKLQQWIADSRVGRSERVLDYEYLRRDAPGAAQQIARWVGVPYREHVTKGVH